MIAGDRNTLRHFNGSTWQQIGMPYDPQIDLVWRGMETKDDITVVVGSHNSNAIIIMIKNINLRLHPPQILTFNTSTPCIK